MGFGALSGWTTVVLQHAHGNPSIMTNEFFQNSTIARRWNYDDEDLADILEKAAMR
jgi:hypothetical protein